jgi:hypothetical protein
MERSIMSKLTRDIQQNPVVVDLGTWCGLRMKPFDGS